MAACMHDRGLTQMSGIPKRMKKPRPKSQNAAIRNVKTMYHIPP
jgi:hypothetical protein